MRVLKILATIALVAVTIYLWVLVVDTKKEYESLQHVFKDGFIKIVFMVISVIPMTLIHRIWRRKQSA